MITLSIELIIKIAIFAIQILFYIILFIKLNGIKDKKTLKNFLEKSKETFKTLFGTVNIDTVKNVIKELKPDKKPEEEPPTEEHSDNG